MLTLINMQVLVSITFQTGEFCCYSQQLKSFQSTEALPLMCFSALTSNTEFAMQRPIHSHQSDCLNVVIVHNLQVFPGDGPRLTLEQIQPCDTM